MTARAAVTIAGDSLFCEARAQMKKLEDDLSSAGAMSASLSDIEQLVRAQGRELMRSLMQAHVDQRAAQEQPVKVRGEDGVERATVRLGERTVMTEFGEVTVARNLYQAPGVTARAPLDAAMALPVEKYSYEVRRIVAEESARSSFDEAVEAVGTRSGAAVPKRQAEELAVRAARDFDAFYRDRLQPAEDTGDLLVLSFDGKGIAMRHDSLRAATRQAAEATPHRRQTRLTKGEKRNRKRMAEVATVYTIERWHRCASDVLGGDAMHAAKRPRPRNKRVWASIEHSAQQVIDDAFAEARRRDPHLGRRWVVLLDGNPDQLRRVEHAAEATGVEVTIVLDIVHVIEYLWRAAHALHPDTSAATAVAAEAWVGVRLRALLDGESPIRLARELRRLSTGSTLPVSAARELTTAAGYLSRHARLMDYSRALADGLPIATGVIEGACRHLIQDRMGRTGARWSLIGAEAIIRLRALRASGDFDDYWQFHLVKEYERTHQERYADGDVPNPLAPTPRRPRLSLVK